MAWKRFAIVTWVFAYTGLIGVPVWWATTSLERPHLPPPSNLEFVALPITFHVTVVASEPGQQPLVPENFQTSLQADAQRAFEDGIPAHGASETVAPGIAVEVHTATSPELCSIPPPSATEPPTCTPSSDDIEHLKTLESASERAASAARTDPHAETPPGHFNIFLIPPQPDMKSSEPSDTSIAWLGASRSAWVWLQGDSIDGAARCAMGMVFRAVLHGAEKHPAAHGESMHAGGGQERLPVSAASELTSIFTLAIAEPPLGVASWSIEDAVQAFWAPVAARLSPLLSLRLETQQRLHARGRLLNPGTAGNIVRSTEGGVTVSEAAMPFFVDSDSWALESGRIVTGHTHPLSANFHGIAEKLLHFVGYVPAASEDPMHVDCGASAAEGASEDGCSGFVVAQWGGVVVLNSASSAVTTLISGGFSNATGLHDASKSRSADQSHWVDTGYKSLNKQSVEHFIGLAAQQFRDMFNLGPAENTFIGREPCSFAADGGWSQHIHLKSSDSRAGACSGGVFVLSPGADVVSLWEMDWLIRSRFSQLISETDQSLRSLLQLVAAMENLEIPAFIGDKVRDAQHQAQEAVDQAKNQGSYEAAMVLARRARVHAEVAQSHHSIATHHSYPAQHKIALYLPLFAPLSLPLLVTLVREVKRKLKGGRKV